jgi:TM2 domain-containing membrane protein YozV
MEQVLISPRSRLIALLLCFFLGYLGIHRFYVGKVGTGLLMLCTAGGLGVWWIIDIIFIACGSFRDKEECRLESWFEPSRTGTV